MSQVTKILPVNRQYRKIFTIRMPLCLAEIYLPTHCFGTERLIGRGIENIVYEVAAGTITGYFSEADIAAVGATGLEKLKNQQFIEEIKKSGNQASQELWDYSHYLETINLAHLNNQELENEYSKQLELIRNIYTHFNVSSPAISAALEQAIDHGLAALGYSAPESREIKAVFLSEQPKTLLDQEEAALRTLADKARAVPELQRLLTETSLKNLIAALTRDFPNFYHQLTAHHEKYKFLQGYVNFQTFDKQYYLYRLRECLIAAPQPLNVLTKQPSRVAAAQLPDEVRHLLSVVNYFSADRMNKRIDYTKGLVVLKKVIDEIARRMGWGVDEVCYLLSEELQNFLRTGIVVGREIVQERKRCAIIMIEDKKTRLLVDIEAKDYAEEYLPKKDITHIREVRGTVGSPGLVRGRSICIVEESNLIKRMDDMKPGDILITSNTRPDMIVACRKAAAIVTNEGGILSHAALVSREFGIPCVIGTKEATKIFKDGDVVEVDANRGVVTLIERP